MEIRITLQNFLLLNLVLGHGRKIWLTVPAEFSLQTRQPKGHVE